MALAKARPPMGGFDVGAGVGVGGGPVGAGMGAAAGHSLAPGSGSALTWEICWSHAPAVRACICIGIGNRCCPSVGAGVGHGVGRGVGSASVPELAFV